MVLSQECSIPEVQVGTYVLKREEGRVNITRLLFFIYSSSYVCSCADAFFFCASRSYVFFSFSHTAYYIRLNELIFTNIFIIIDRIGNSESGKCFY